MDDTEFYMPFDSEGVNPAESAAEQAMWAWLERYDLVPSGPTRRRVHRTRPARMYALWCPYADVNALGLLSRFTAWAFIVDDQFDIERPDPARTLATITALEEVFEPEAAPAGVLAVAFADLWTDLCAGRSSQWRHAVRTEISAWLWTYYTESIGRLTGHYPDLDDYRAHRRDSVALYVFLDISEIAEGVDPGSAARGLPALRRLREAAVEHMGLFNDILSVDSDEASDYLYNSVLLAERQGRTRAQAIELVDDMLTRCVRRMLTAIDQLPAELDAAGLSGRERSDILTTATNYTRYVRANFDYHYQAARYTSAPREALEHGAPLT
ncbi:terpene synthase family protein [Nocardia veterana]|uniref:Terpene cyclase n=1 Tax=Nocardia veterana TaxID=132249 RepID=A0A7X6RH78_9NOCA|nr:terpene synthase family protein [Nocardia veterana]NKY85328.1 terpene cyclase [Nocardia veterana]